LTAKNGAAFVDQFDPYMAVLLRERKENPSRFVGMGDAVHPGPTGHTVMAWAILKGLGASAEVSRAEIDATTQTVTASAGCHVDQIKLNGGVLGFDRLDEALPMPIDERAEPALKLAPITEDLNRLELRVTGLKDGNYEVAIDGEAAGKVSAADLAKGWNLANASGPITKQAREVLKLVFEKNNLYMHRWREVQLFSLPGWAQGPEAEAGRAREEERLDHEIAEKEGQIDKARKPVPHHFELKPAA